MNKLVWSACGALALTGCGESASEAVDGVGNQIQFGQQAGMQAQLAQVRTELQAFHGEHGRWPDTLDELAEERDYRIPMPPAGYNWAYDSNAGTVKPFKMP